MANIDEKKKERKARAREYDKEIFGKYFEQVLVISKKMIEGFRIEGKTVIGIAKPENKEPFLVFAGRSSFLPFSKVDFATII